MSDQKQFGIAATQTLVMVPVDDLGAPDTDSLAPHPRPEEWTTPDLIPLVKLPAPAHDPATHQCEPVLVWYQDRVHRDWMVSERISSAENTYNTARSNLAAYWASQPAWIRGPFDASYQSAVSLLDRHDIDAAIAILTYAPIPSAYDADQLAVFETIMATLLAGLESLRGE
jgi:hypothetical protein